ncbi:pre-toxin TG domain-containing protein, partial [Thermoactinomyces mirandus]
QAALRCPKSSAVVDCIPVISNIKNYIDLTSGKDSISGDKLDPVDKVITVIGIASGPGKKLGGALKGFFNGGKKFLKRFGIHIDDLAERLGLGPRLQPAGGPSHIPEKSQVNKLEGTNGGGGSGSGDNRKGGFIKVDENKIIQTAMKPKKGGEMVVGHALQKHAGRNPHIWGKVKGGPDQINQMALNHLREILNGPGEFIKVKNARGIEFLEKKLPDGRGVRLNMDGTFKGFIDQ